MNILDDKSRTELQRYIRLFCSRSLQVIIQSRLQASIKNFGKNRKILNDHLILICKFIFLIKKDQKWVYHKSKKLTTFSDIIFYMKE